MHSWVILRLSINNINHYKYHVSRVMPRNNLRMILEKPGIGNALTNFLAAAPDNTFLNEVKMVRYSPKKVLANILLEGLGEE